MKEVWKGDTNQRARDNPRVPVFAVPGDDTTPRTKTQGTALLSTGNFGSPTLAQGQVVQGVAGTQFESLTVTSSTVLQGVRVTGQVTVTAAGSLVALGCLFDRTITVAAQGKVVLTGCQYDTMVNAGLPVNCAIVGCRRTGAVPVNVTIISEIT